MKLIPRVAIPLLPIILAVLSVGSRSFGLVTQQDPKVSVNETTLHSHLARLFPNGARFPYWNRVGCVGDGTGVYLGDGFVLTASHVGPNHFVQPNGARYPLIENSGRIYTNPDNSVTDLCVFQVKVPQGSPLSGVGKLPVRLSGLERNSDILLLGSGFGRKSDSLLWMDDHKLRWGINKSGELSNAPYQDRNRQTHGFFTLFGTGACDCQGAPGDSGGAVFHYNREEKRWELAGLIIASTSKPDANCSTPGDQTFIANLAPLNHQPVKETSPFSWTVVQEKPTLDSSRRPFSFLNRKSPKSRPKFRFHRK